MLGRTLARYTIFVLIPLGVVVWLVNLVLEADFAGILYKALLVLTVAWIVLGVLGGGADSGSARGKRGWPVSFPGRREAASGPRRH